MFNVGCIVQFIVYSIVAVALWEQYTVAKIIIADISVPEHSMYACRITWYIAISSVNTTSTWAQML